MSNLVAIDNKRKRNRLASVPIFTALGNRERTESNSSDISSEGEVNSPDSKKVRKDQSEVMNTMDMVNEELAVVYATEAISKLGMETKNKDIKTLIDCYNPIIDMEMMKKHMLEASENWRDKERKYKLAIKFVVNDEKEIEETDIGELAEILLEAIVNRTTKYCNDCRKWYMVGRKNKPKIFCSGCNVGMHDCKNLNEIQKIHGLQWFCSECNELFILQLQPTIKKIMKNYNTFKGFEESNIQGKNSSKEISKKIEEIRKGTDNDEDEIINLEAIIVSKAKEREQKDMNKIEIVAEVHMEENGRMRKENKERGTNKTIEDRDSNERSKESNKNKERNDKHENPKEICWFWKNKKCRFKTNCKHDHPEQCKEMLETGRCNNSRCKLIHPKICRNLFFKGHCPRGESCWFTHPSKCQNNQPKNIMENSYTSNQGLYSNRQNQNMNINSQNMSPNFLGAWPTPANINNQQSYGISQNPPMILMMQNMMEKLTQMDSKISHLERGRQMLY